MKEYIMAIINPYDSTGAKKPKRKLCSKAGAAFSLSM
eukprot:CAMPEP_0201631990 /NCGR_PEP_ID=MMETSP0493-20130528/5776_1 /ASSEMBLY_ACC=CAM_ASM_000838 /TAXON_ID=420259 /ORGANISM="Thalassiosira gravida, Strain GMp14c1" /LENGTH=36 /DNA_ID= /DNA_START= /DNA_END= /DNA_ORIENTATION=